MDTLSFLRLIWPEGGLYLLAEPRTYRGKEGEEVPYFQHYAHNTVESAAASAVHRAAQGASVFYALASVKDDYSNLKKPEREALGVKVRGIHKSGHDNTFAVKSFWLDLDVGDDPKKYLTQADAAAALRGFYKAMGLPKPYVVSSGGGLHVYWPLADSISSEEWRTHSAILKALTVSAGLKADPSRTADVASILRPVGTFNHKTDVSRPVQCVVEGEVTPAAAFLATLQRLKEMTGVVVQEYVRRDVANALGALPSWLAGTAEVNEQAAQGAGLPPPKASNVVKHCQQLMAQKTNPMAVSEPSWYAMVGCLRFCSNGDKAVHLMSQGHTEYSQDRTDTKLIQHENSGTGPTLCATFESHNPGGCDGCPMRGKIKTPLQSVRELPVAPPAQVEMAQPDGTSVMLEIPPPPSPFKRILIPGKDHGSIAIIIEAEGRQFDEVIYDYDIYPVRMIFDEREGVYMVVLRRWLPHEGWSEVNVPTGRFYDKKQLAITLGNIGVMADASKIEILVQYMVAYIRDLQKHAAANVIYAQLGWRDDKHLFILPDRVVSKTGVERIEPSVNVKNSLGWREPQGDLEVWKKVVAIYEREGMVGFQFGFGVGFAAPLFRFTNFNGAIVSLVGKRGAGKSSAALCANSIWGHTRNGWMDMQHDTWKSFYGKLGALNNLPATYDEVTNLEPDKLSDLAYAITKGQGRQRLQANGQAQENYGNWNTMMLTTSNSSLHGRLAMAKADSSAEASRIFEYELPQNTLTKIEADENFDKLNDHFGLAAEPYASALLNNSEWVRERVKYWIKRIDTEAGVGSSERFWSAVPACVLAGFEVANKIGLTNASTDRLLAFAVEQIKVMRGTVVETVSTAESMVSDYINSNMRSMIVIGSDAVGTTMAHVTMSPSSDKLRIRLERHNGRLYFDRADFRRHCSANGFDPKAVASELTTKGILKASDTKIVLGRGTTFSTTQSWCWLLDFNHPSLSGVAGLVDSAPTAQEQAV